MCMHTYNYIAYAGVSEIDDSCVRCLSGGCSKL